MQVPPQRLHPGNNDPDKKKSFDDSMALAKQLKLSITDVKLRFKVHMKRNCLFSTLVNLMSLITNIAMKSSRNFWKWRNYPSKVRFRWFRGLGRVLRFDILGLTVHKRKSRNKGIPQHCPSMACCTSTFSRSFLRRSEATFRHQEYPDNGTLWKNCLRLLMVGFWVF